MASHIVCFGDSLTAGYQVPTRENPGGVQTPYGEFLKQRLGPQVQIAISGICGELTAEMAMRFRRDVLARTPRYVVILGGTNDLGWNAQPADIMRNLLKMYETARAGGIVPVPVTVPSIRIDVMEAGREGQTFIEQHLGRRDELNALIQRYAESKDLAWVDLFTATAEPTTRQLAEQYSNDGLHLSTEGYQQFATLLYDRIFGEAFSSTENTR
ncbi:arylesterase [Nitrospira sp. KM1]|uniref:SGNH/GDSL hydrolase family protein n=1 Tax=Nitrospira sp. KM1 TaxID=1936990 RepID=UPI0013A7ADAB|nr:GDSL-type esterase/lipase family protein [Nitrospira sp. KM1]BCA53856.1 arylesterase [Nitrospira sp. KM1]